MLNRPTINRRKFLSDSGDTIVEVLIAIAVAAFAIGTSYAIASRSLNQAITARERNEATNIIQNQINALKLRFINDQAAFGGTDPKYDNPVIGFSVRTTSATPPPSGLPYTDFHFCLNEQSASPNDAAQQWARIPNVASDSEADNISSTNTYNKGNGGNNPGCIRNISGTEYFIDISAEITAGSKTAKNRTVYKVEVRWPEIASGDTAQTVVYYRL